MSVDPDSNPLAEATKDTLRPRASDGADDWDRFRSNVKTIVGAVLLAVLIRIVLFEAFEIDGPSMEPTLLNEDRVVVAKCLYGLFLPRMHEAVVNWGMPDLGDVVILNSPGTPGMNTPEEQQVDIVKRVIGLPGDTVELRGATVYRNGTAIPTRDVGACGDDQQKEFDPECRRYEERIGDHVYRTSHARQWTAPESPVTVPPGHVFVLGDHRDHSNDSRAIGPIPLERLKGRALFIYLSGSILRGEVRWHRIGQAID